MRRRNLKQAILDCLVDFYQRRTDRLGKLDLNDLLKHKNPYLLRALGIDKPDELVESMLDSFLKEGDETSFGEALFERIALWAAQRRGGHKSNAPGIDLEIEDSNTIHLYSVKSSPNWGNSSQWKALEQDFKDIIGRRRKSGKGIDCVVGSATGARASRSSRGQKRGLERKISGQSFWREISNDPEFYLKIIDSMDEKVVLNAKKDFDIEYSQALSKYRAEFKRDFCGKNGRIDWEAVVRFNSGEK